MINDWREILGWPYTDWERRLELARDARDIGEEDEDDGAGYE